MRRELFTGNRIMIHAWIGHWSCRARASRLHFGRLELEDLSFYIF